MGEFGGQIPVEPPRDGRDSLGVGNSNDKLTVARIRLLGIIGVALPFNLRREGADKTWGSCGPSAVCDGQSTIKDGGPCDGYSVSPFGRPPHPSAFSHAGIGNVIDCSFGTR